MADSPSYQTREDYLRAAQIKLDQAALYLICAEDERRAETAIQLAREVRALRRGEA